jgi:two-component system, response regulator YesN
MINILVVDDEPIIVNSLYQMLCQVAEWPLAVYKASSASLALDLARNTRVDIMLSDINMPGMDGLELQRAMRLEWPQCHVIFLTGYDSFEYAQQAVRQGSSGYVLKVEGDEAILTALRHSIGQIERERENQRLLKSVQSARPLLLREFIGDLMQSRKFTDHELSEFMILTASPLQHDMPAFLLLTAIHPDSDLRDSGNDLGGLLGVISIMHEYLADRVRLISAPQPPDMIVTLYQPVQDTDMPEAWPAAYRRVRETLEEIQESSQRMLGFLTSHAIASEQCGWNDLAVKRAHLESVVRIYGFDNHSIITDETLVHAEGQTGRSDQAEILLPSPHQLAQLRQFLNANDEEGMAAFLSDFYSTLRSKEVPFPIAKEIYYSLALVFLHSINVMAENIKWRVDPELLTSMKTHYSWNKVFEYFAEVGRSIIRSRSSEKTAFNRQIVEQVNDYVNSHLHEDVGLISLAERLHFHPSYLARLYKHISGITVGQYIVDMRLQQARRLLSSADTQIGDIAKSLGFASAAYFSKFFKTHAGLTPSDYRRQMLP